MDKPDEWNPTQDMGVSWNQGHCCQGTWCSSSFQWCVSLNISCTDSLSHSFIVQLLMRMSLRLYPRFFPSHTTVQHALRSMPRHAINLHFLTSQWSWSWTRVSWNSKRSSLARPKWLKLTGCHLTGKQTIDSCLLWLKCGHLVENSISRCLLSLTSWVVPMSNHIQHFWRRSQCGMYEERRERVFSYALYIVQLQAKWPMRMSVISLKWIIFCTSKRHVIVFIFLLLWRSHVLNEYPSSFNHPTAMALKSTLDWQARVKCGTISR